jgi:hypothetical protein
MSDPVGRYLSRYRQDDPVERYLSRYGTTDGKQAVAKELFAGASQFGELGDDLKEPTAADVIGLNDPKGKLKQLAASLPEMGAMAAAGAMALGGTNEQAMEPYDHAKAQAARQPADRVIEKIDELAGGQPTDMLGTAARVLGPAPLYGAAKMGAKVAGPIASKVAKRVAEAPLPSIANELGVIGLNQARKLDIKPAMPSDVAFREAVTLTEGAELTDEGLRINLRRYQHPDQAGMESLRTGVFYLPKGDKNERFFRNPKAGYGGVQAVEGETLIRRPLAIKGGVGGNVPARAYDQIKGKGAHEVMRKDVLGSVVGWNKRVTAAEVSDLLARYDADPDLAGDILAYSKGGNTLPYAIQENIIAHAVRNAGYEAVVGYSKGKKGHFISEVFDVRESHYPTPGQPGEVHPAFTERGMGEAGAAGTKTLSALALTGTGAALTQSENPELQATGTGILALTAMHGIGAKRFRKMGQKVGGSLVSRLPKGLIERTNPDALLTPEVRSAIKQYELDVSTASARAKELGGKSRALGPKADRKVSDIIEGENFEPGQLSPKDTEAVLAVAAQITEEFTKQGQKKVAAGLLPERAVAKREGAYLPRKYAYHEAQDVAGNLPPGTSAKKVRVGPEHARQDLAPDIRTLLGEIREASYRTEQGLTKGGKDLAAQRLFETLKSSPGAMHPGYAEAADALRLARQAGNHKGIVEAQQRIRDLTRAAGKDYVVLPDTRGLGPLRGALVRSEVANSINGISEIKGAGGKLLTYWKKAHTVYNPGTHVGNFFSNVTLAHMAGLNLWEMPTALRAAQIELRRYGPAAKALTESRKVFASQGVTPLGPVEKAMRKADQKISKTYNNEDNVFRVALYRKMVKDGMAPKEAAEYVREELINFRTRSPAIKLIKDSGLSPFILYPAKALPLAARQIVEHPWRWITLAATWGAVDQYSQRTQGRIPDEDLSDRDQRSKMGYMMPGMTQLPVKGSDGEKFGFDVSRFTPLSAVTTGGVPGSTGSALSGNLPQVLQPSGPLVDILARGAMNTDPFTGDKFIRPSDNATDILKKATLGKVGAGTFTPGALAGLALPSALSYQAPRIASDLANDDTKAAKVDAFGLAGLRPRVIRPGQEGEMRRYKEQREMQDIQAEMRRDLRKAKSQEARISVFERARKKRTALLKRIRQNPQLAENE